MRIEVNAFCCRDNPVARHPRPLEGVGGCERVIYKRDRTMAYRLADFAEQHGLPPPKIVLESDDFPPSLLVVRNSPYLTARPTVLSDMAAGAGLVCIHLDPPIWRFPSGAWVLEATRGYPILQRALALLRTLVPAPAPHSAQE